MHMDDLYFSFYVFDFVASFYSSKNVGPSRGGGPKSVLEGWWPADFGCFLPSTLPDTSDWVINRHVLTLMTRWWRPLIRIRCFKAGKPAGHRPSRADFRHPCPWACADFQVSIGDGDISIQCLYCSWANRLRMTLYHDNHDEESSVTGKVFLQISGLTSMLVLIAKPYLKPSQGWVFSGC